MWGRGRQGKLGQEGEGATGSAGAIRAWRAGAGVSCGVLGDGGVSPGPGEDVRTVCSQVPSCLARVGGGRAGLEDGARRRVESELV